MRPPCLSQTTNTGGWGLGVGGCELASAFGLAMLLMVVHHLAKQPDGDVRQGGALVAMLRAQLGELGRKDEPGTNGDWPRAGGVAVSEQLCSERGNFGRWHVEREPAVETCMPAKMGVMLVGIRAARLDQRRPTRRRLPDRREHGMQAVLQSPQTLSRLMEFL